MDESNIWIIGVVALALGALIGYLLGRSGNDSGQQQALEDAQQELAEYKEKVAGHFEETADLVNKMTESYRDVYKHLASSAQTLCDAETARSIESSMVPQLKAEPAPQAEKEVKPCCESKNPAADKSVEPPRDYAPKKPDEEGTLSETYGLKEKEKQAAKAAEKKAAAKPAEDSDNDDPVEHTEAEKRS